MIISDKYKYVYIGIPRTGSKSMNHWLCSYFDGRSHGGHHDYDVPEGISDYLIFTVVRNPYDRAVSGHFGVTWGAAKPQENESPFPPQPDYSDCRDAQERCTKLRVHLKARERREQRPMPAQSPIPLEERIRSAKALNETDGNAINQKRFVDRARVRLALYFERLPQCLRELPFVDPGDVPPIPNHPERGIRPPGTFFDVFRDTDEEQVQWAYAAEDCEAFGYRRFDAGLPKDAPNALWMR